MPELLEEKVGRLLLKKHMTIACAESCTGGLLTSRLTDIAGSSAYVMGSVVSYTNRIKEALVGVRHETLAAHGAVSEETAREMAEGIRKAIKTDIGVGITGIAGPGPHRSPRPSSAYPAAKPHGRPVPGGAWPGSSDGGPGLLSCGPTAHAS